MKQRATFWVGCLLLLGAFVAPFSLLPLAGCSKKAPIAVVIAQADIRRELAPAMPGAAITFDDKHYSSLPHEWTEKALERHLARTWHDRAYAPELKDCDDFTDFMVSTVRHEFGEAAPAGSGGALLGRYTIFIPEADQGRGAWHRVGLARTDRGWFVADPLALVPRPWRIRLVPLAEYRRRARGASF